MKRLNISSRQLTLLQIGILAALLSLTIAGWTLTSAEQPRTASTADYSIPSALLDDRAIASDVSDILERPLFWASRRPVEAAEEQAANDVISVDGIRVLGIIVKGGTPSVLLNTGQRIARARVGDDVSGWRVNAIATHSVTLASGDRVVELQITAPRNPLIRLDPVEAQ